HVVADGNTPQTLAVRASILLMLADRVRPSHVATRLALSRNHVHYWVQRYLAAGIGGVLHDAPRPGRRKRITPEQVATIVDATSRPARRRRPIGARARWRRPKASAKG
ncbi:MAG: helix-turn-helix domain-containing protein, partial [Luteitalea sp.]|nr:helix-turn-helix domain-containing protein [Luteitalea sp.]